RAPAVARQSPAILLLLSKRLKRAGGDPTPLLQAAQRRHLGDFWIHFFLAWAMEDQPVMAAGHGRAAIAVRPDSTLAHNDLRVFLFDQRGWTGGAVHAAKARALDPTNPRAPYQRAQALHSKGNRPGAIENYEKAIALDPNFPNAHNNLGLVFLEQNKLPKAMEHFERAIALGARHETVFINLGGALLRHGDL